MASGDWLPAANTGKSPPGSSLPWEGDVNIGTIVIVVLVVLGILFILTRL